MKYPVEHNIILLHVAFLKGNECYHRLNHRSVLTAGILRET